MANQISKLILFVVLAALFFSFKLPDGWDKWEIPGTYKVNVDINQSKYGIGIFTIQSTDLAKKFYKRNVKGEVSKNISAYSLAGKRVKLRGRFKSEGVQFHGRIILEYTVAKYPESNCSPAKLYALGTYRGFRRGTSDWIEKEFIFDVPANATTILYGASLSGCGKISFEFSDIEIVDRSQNVNRKAQQIGNEM